MKIYIAGPFFTKEQLDFIKEIENSINDIRIPYFSPRSVGIISNMSPKEKLERMLEVYRSNVLNMHSCDVMISVIDGRDTGTTFELGYFTCLKEMAKDTLRKKKYIISVTNENHGINVMLKESIDLHLIGLEKLNQYLCYIKNNGELPLHENNFSGNVT